MKKGDGVVIAVTKIKNGTKQRAQMLKDCI